MWRTGVVALFAAICLSEPALAQNSRITGTVRAADGSGPVFGAEVVVSGTKLGATTREDGRYTIAVGAGTYRVRAKRIGYTPDSMSVTVAAGATVTADFNLKSAANQISGVVITGYGGIRDVRDRTGVVETIKEKNFNTGRIVSPEQLLQAKVAGVQVIDNNEPGGGISLRIRGGTSVNASNEPLFVLDGVPLPVGGGVSSGRNPLNFLNPADIASITVLKDASATAIYGSRGANGVVMITTKSGGTGAAAFTFSSNYSASSIVKKPGLLNSTQYRAAVTQFAPENVKNLGAASTDWYDAVLRGAGGAEQNLSVSGSKDDMKYRLSISHLNQDGILKGTNSSRSTMGLTYSDLLLNDRLEFRANLKGSQALDAFTPGGVIGAATAMAPTQPIRNADGTYFQWTDPLGANNPLSDLSKIQDNGTTYRSVGNMEAKYNMPWVEGLSATLRTGYDFTQSTRTTFQPSTAQGQLEASNGGRFDRNNPRQINTVLEAFGTWTKKFDDLGNNFDATAGYTFEESKGDYPWFWAQTLSTDLLGSYGVPSAKTSANFLDIQESKLISFFGRANYTMNDKYLLTASVRRDGSSRFGPGKQWGIFPSVAGAWRIIDEPWMQKFTKLSDLKLRGSWGLNGNQSFGNYLFVSTYTVGGAQAQYQFGNNYYSTIRPSAVDPNIKWEQTASTNFGIDYGFWDNRITGSLDMYTKTTKDLIFRVPVAAGTNNSNFVTTNIGSMKNSGVELTVNAVMLEGKKSPWRWDASFAVSHNANEITSVSGSGTDKILTGGIAGGVGNTIQVLQPGKPINTFLVFRHKSVNGKPVTGNKTDLELYEDINKDGAITQSDKVPYKNPAPNLIIGHTSTASYKNWDASMTARMYLGNYTYNNVASTLGTYRALKGTNAPANLEKSVLKYGFTNTQYFSDLYIEDASFFRLDNISVGYTFKNITQVKGLRVFGAVQNVFTSTKYSGVDPMAGVNGIDNNLFPLSRTFTAGLNVGF